jgi:hypothetical protein
MLKAVLLVGALFLVVFVYFRELAKENINGRKQ